MPNIITLLRIAGSLGLLLCDVTGVAYWIIYSLCGISDIVDGWLARKLKCVTKTGALLDSVADICFVACCVWKLLPILELPQLLWLWAGVIVAIKNVNQISALAMYGHCCFPHTTVNKVTGFMLFIAVPMTLALPSSVTTWPSSSELGWFSLLFPFCTVIPITIVASIATFAAIQEGHVIRTRNTMRKIVTLVYVLVVTSSWAQEPISDSTRPSSYGACIMRNDSIIGINENERFAMHSVMKFPQALYVADCLSRKGLSLDDTIVVDKADLMQDTWSPMLKRFEGKMAFSYAELLALSLGQSDNNASELLFKHCGKPKAVEKYMRKLGFRDIHVCMTEEQMHKNPAKPIENSSTPAEMVRLFEWFYHHKDDNQYLAFIWKSMADCSTGLKRISAAIPADARIVHKTGTGFPSAEGLQDMNDAGIILMPDGRHVIIAVFTSRSPSETVIADIARQLLERIR